MKKKIASFTALVLLAACLFSIPAQAAVPSTVAPCFEDIHLFYATIDITESGYATAYSYAACATSSNKVYLTVYLQQLINGVWSNVTYASSANTKSVSSTASTYVSSGYYYRAKGYATVYTSTGTFVETATIYSNSKYY